MTPARTLPCFLPPVSGRFAPRILLPFIWVAPAQATDIILMASMSLFGGIGHYAVILSLQRVEASETAPLNYLGVVFAMFWGFMVFAEIPSMATLSGAVIIILLWIIFMAAGKNSQKKNQKALSKNKWFSAFIASYGKVSFQFPPRRFAMLRQTSAEPILRILSWIALQSHSPSRKPKLYLTGQIHLALKAQLSEEERMVRDTAKAYADEKLMPRIIEAFREEKTDAEIFREMGALGLLGLQSVRIMAGRG